MHVCICVLLASTGFMHIERGRDEMGWIDQQGGIPASRTCTPFGHARQAYQESRE